jgi:hypothetical protein
MISRFDARCLEMKCYIDCFGMELAIGEEEGVVG